jgi:hypothetical protein
MTKQQTLEAVQRLREEFKKLNKLFDQYFAKLHTK